MKSVLLVVLFAVAASAAVIGNDVPDAADVNVNELAKVFVTDVDELTDADELTQNAVASRNSINMGNVLHTDVLVYNERIRANRAIDINASLNRPISGIRVNPSGTTFIAHPTIVSGGIGQRSAVIRIAPLFAGQVFEYIVQIWVR